MPVPYEQLFPLGSGSPALVDTLVFDRGRQRLAAEATLGGTVGHAGFAGGADLGACPADDHARRPYDNCNGERDTQEQDEREHRISGRLIQQPSHTGSLSPLAALERLLWVAALAFYIGADALKVAESLYVAPLTTAIERSLAR